MDQGAYTATYILGTYILYRKKTSTEKTMSEVYARASLARHRQRSRYRRAHVLQPTPPCPRRRAHPHARARTHHIPPVQSISTTRSMAPLPPPTPHHHHSSSSSSWRRAMRALASLLLMAPLAACDAFASPTVDQHSLQTHLHNHATQQHLSTAPTAPHTHRTAPRPLSSLHPCPLAPPTPTLSRCFHPSPPPASTLHSSMASPNTSFLHSLSPIGIACPPSVGLKPSPLQQQHVTGLVPRSSKPKLPRAAQRNERHRGGESTS